MVKIDQYDDMLDSIEKEFVDPLGNDLSVIKRDSKFESESSPLKLDASFSPQLSPQILQEDKHNKFLQKNGDSTLQLLEEL